MAIDRGHGIATSSVLADSYDLDALIADTEAAKVAAELAETNAETAETNAATSATASATSATASAASASSVSGEAAAAAASATAAAASATAAATSKTGAETAETNAETAETNAETAETNAETAEAAALVSKNAAATSATAAASSASGASTSASTATTQASTATTKASEASTSATNAASSATAAASSETAAASSATAGATSASTATTKASEASTSAGTATTKASEAATSATASATSATASAASATAAAATKDSIDDFYLGAQSSNPTVDNNGAAITAGDWYFNTTSNETRIYSGSAWQVTAVSTDAFLPKAGGTMTGTTVHGDNVKDTYGTGADLEIYHNGSNSFISDVGTGNLKLVGTNIDVEDASGYNMVTMTADGAVDIYHNHAKKFETTANGVTVTGGAVGTMTTDNDGSFAMSASNNFKCTPAGDFALTFTAIVAQSGNILFINSGGHTISAHANTKVDANLLATISTAGTYLLSYFSDGTNVYMTNSAAYA